MHLRLRVTSVRTSAIHELVNSFSLLNKPCIKAATSTSTSPSQTPQRPLSQQRGSASSLASRGSSPSPITSPILALTPSGSSSALPLSSTRRLPLLYPSRPLLLPYHVRACPRHAHPSSPPPQPLQTAACSPPPPHVHPSPARLSPC